MEEKIVCQECLTENEPQYEFCKNCGAQLRESEPKTQENFKQTAYNGYRANFPGGKIVLDDIDGNNTNDVAVFIGKNAHNFIPKFSKMQLSGSKISWCWPAAILGFFFGPLGAALWFLYRKMYKIGAMIMAVGFLLSALNAALFGTAIPFEEMFNSILQSIETGNTDIALFDTFQQSAVYSFIENVICYVCAIFCGLFGMHFYKKTAVNKIAGVKEKYFDTQYYHLGLATVGGTSGGALFLGFVAMAILNNIISLIPSFV